MARMPPLAIRPRPYSTLRAPRGRNSLRDIRLSNLPPPFPASRPRAIPRIRRTEPAGAVTRGKIKIPPGEGAQCGEPPSTGACFSSRFSRDSLPAGTRATHCRYVNSRYLSRKGCREIG